MEPVAIIGFSFRLPQDVEDPSSLWGMLESGRNVMTDWPESRANVDAFSHSASATTNTVKSRGAHFMKDHPAAFDAPFFSITSKEAASMDPQQRLLLETSYHALENAGIPAERVSGTETAVFAGSMADDYIKVIAKDPDNAPTNTATGSSPAILANRLSWYFDLKGPSIQLNTACSTSMIAMDLACQSLRNGQSSMALVTGSNVILTIENSLYMTNMNFLSPDSLSYSFDHRANGYARGEGVIVMVLKTLSDAIRDHDMIRAVIRATGSNQDGRTPGITQPSSAAQEQLIRNVYKSCHLELGLTRYVEAHGTGTQVGDSGELNALGRVFRTSRSPTEPLYVGSIKANIGHLEGGSGLAGILKCIMILEKGIIPPNPLFEKMNPSINAKFYNIQVPTSCIVWPTDGLRRISINSFGFGGSNGHIIMDDAYHTLRELGIEGLHCTSITPIGPDSVGKIPVFDNTSTNGDTRVATVVNGVSTSSQLSNRASSGGPTRVTNGHLDSSQADNHTQATRSSEAPAPKSNGTLAPETHKSATKYQVLIWSAKDEAALTRILKRHANYYQTHIAGSQDMLNRLSYTLAARRSPMSWRSFATVEAGSTPDPTSILNASMSNIIRSVRNPCLAFVFTGQGAQYPKMGLELLQYPVFEDVLNRASSVFRGMGAKWTLLDEIQTGERINRPELSQPLCTVIQIALVELLKSFGIKPTAVIGHSSGEIAAAYASGALSFESACKVAYHRGRLAGELISSLSRPSAMMSVNLSESEAQAYLERISLGSEMYVACVNSPFNVTISGYEPDIDRLKSYLDKDEIFAQKLKTGIAYHSPIMRGIAAEYLSCLGILDSGVRSGENILMVSSVTGQPIPYNTASDCQYWIDNLVSAVRFNDALQYLATVAPKLDNKQLSDYLEIGPHGALRRPICDTLTQVIGSNGYSYTSVMTRFDSPVKTVMETAGRLFSKGYAVSITSDNQQETHKRPIPFLVDIPEYPFDHSQLHYYESRLSREWRLRKTVTRSLLGIPSTDWNPLEPQWRNYLSVEKIPWIADHVVGDTIFFPGTGTLTIALEAVRQTSQSHEAISAYLIKEATFSNPIIVGREGQTEIMTKLRPLQQPYEKTSRRSEVRVFALVGGHWTECFKALIHTEYKEPLTEVDGGNEARAFAQSLMRNYEDAKTACINPISEKNFYKWHHDQGLKYGKAFSLADGIGWDGGERGVAWVDVGPPTEPFEGIVHPAVLDAACQVCFAAPSNGMSDKLPTIIPHKMHNAWISASGWQYPHTRQIRMLTTSRFKSTVKGLDCSFTALADDGAPLCHVKRLEMLPIMGEDTRSDSSRKLFHSIDWKPDLSLLSADQLRQYCRVDDDLQDEGDAVDYCTQLEMTLRRVLARTVHDMAPGEWSGAPPHMEKYVSWMKRQVHKVPIRSKIDVSEEQLNHDLEDLKRRRPSWGLFIDVAQNLRSIVRGDIDALEFLFSSSRARDVYFEFYNRVFDQRLISFLELAAHQTPNQKILEVGAGTGSLTSRILPTLKAFEERTGGIAFAEYTYTDISPAFFEEARQQFVEHQDRMTYKLLDLEQDITTQGFDPGSYDMIVAGGVLHATRNLTATLENLRRALKPGGHLVFHETTAPDCFSMSFGFGILPGWWRSEEDFRAGCPTITGAEWDVLLRKNGFSGNDMIIRDYRDDAAHYASFIVSTALDNAQLWVKSPSTLIIVNDDDDFQLRVASSIANEAVDLFNGEKPTVITMAQLGDQKISENTCVLLLADMGTTLLSNISETTFRLIQGCLQQSKSLLWVSSSDVSCGPDLTPLPYPGLKDGLLRTLRSEFNSKRLVSLSFEDETLNMEACVNIICQVFSTAFRKLSPEVEYVVQDGKILTGRLVEELDANYDINSYLSSQVQNGSWIDGPPLKLDIGSRGSLETLQYVEDKDYYTDLGPSEVEIEARAWGVNFRDMFGALGRLQEDGFGTDCAGIVTRVGSHCSSIQPGDRVCMCAVGCMRAYPRSDEWATVKIPDSVTFEEACAVISPGVTAWYSLVELGRLKKNEKILIHAASGATGQATIQVAQMIGAEVFATVGYNHKKKLLMDHYHIPEDHIFYSRDLSFAKGIMRVTAGYGVDVVLNSLVGDGLRASLECVAPYGRFIEIGKADINSNASLPMGQFANNLSFSSVDLRHTFAYRKESARELLCKVMELTRDARIRHPEPLHTFGVMAVEDAFRYFQSGKNTGRIVINVDPNAQVQKHIKYRSTWKFNENATYLIVGGLGGIGRSVVRWMALKGAKHLMILSRSGNASQSARDLVDELVKNNVEVITPKCDVSSENALRQVLEQYEKTMPPIRGCINAAMVLNDSIFDNMSYAQWQRTILSKVQTSWNLHSNLPADLDFFIMLSSVAGVVGNVSQANYAAGCTFQDSLARYRVQQGQKAVSIDLGLMRDIGLVAETEALQQTFEGYLGYGQIEEKELIAALDMCCDPTRNPPYRQKHQITMGVTTPADLLTDGKEVEVGMLERPLFSHFSQTRKMLPTSQTRNQINFSLLFRQAESVEERSKVAVRSLTLKLARALSIQPEDVDTEQPLHAYGVDSLVAVELRNWIAKEFAADVPVFEIMGGRSVAVIGELVTKASRIGKGNTEKKN
ncbi:polyketide synthase PksD [Annulohypoxylon moriforme]|nr:polyketide synthase PksD [Annulohypoxylon moriforme]